MGEDLCLFLSVPYREEWGHSEHHGQRLRQTGSGAPACAQRPGGNTQLSRLIKAYNNWGCLLRRSSRELLIVWDTHGPTGDREETGERQEKKRQERGLGM